jgi:hypothetical protein
MYQIEIQVRNSLGIQKIIIQEYHTAFLTNINIVLEYRGCQKTTLILTDLRVNKYIGSLLIVRKYSIPLKKLRKKIMTFF